MDRTVRRRGIGSLRRAGAGARSLRSTLVRRAVLVLATLAAATLALAARADAYIYWTNHEATPSGAPTSTARRRTRASSRRRRPRSVSRSTAPASTGRTHRHDRAREPGRDGGEPELHRRADLDRASEVAVDGAHIYWVSKFSDAHSRPSPWLPVPARSGAPTSTAPASTRISSAGLAFPPAGWRSMAPTSTGPVMTPLTRFCDPDEGRFAAQDWARQPGRYGRRGELHCRRTRQSTGWPSTRRTSGGYTLRSAIDGEPDGSARRPGRHGRRVRH